MARSTMADLIILLRNWSQVNADDYSVTSLKGKTQYWNDDQLQAVLDRHRSYVRREELECIPEYTGGTTYYKDFFSKYHFFESTDGGTATFLVEDSNGDARSTSDWTANYWDGYLRFSIDQAGTALYLTGNSYDIHAASAEIWRTKAANVSSYYDFTADGQSLSRSQWYQHCIEQAQFHESFGQAVTVGLARSDAV
jgi:hypothetical protein